MDIDNGNVNDLELGKIEEVKKVMDDGVLNELKKNNTKRTRKRRQSKRIKNQFDLADMNSRI